MTRPLISLQDLRRRIYAKAKAEPSWRFWGLFVHVCKEETLREAYRLAKKNEGAPGIDGVTFAAIEESGVDAFIGQIRDELVSREYGVGAVLQDRVRNPRCLEKEPSADSGVQALEQLTVGPSLPDRHLSSHGSVRSGEHGA